MDKSIEIAWKSLFSHSRDNGLSQDRLVALTSAVIISCGAGRGSQGLVGGCDRRVGEPLLDKGAGHVCGTTCKFDCENNGIADVAQGVRKYIAGVFGDVDDSDTTRRLEFNSSCLESADGHNDVWDAKLGVRSGSGFSAERRDNLSNVCNGTTEFGKDASGSDASKISGSYVRFTEEFVVDGVKRGPNYERNKKNREIQKKRKQKKRRLQGKSWRDVEDKVIQVDSIVESAGEKIVGSLDHLLVPVVEEKKTDLRKSLEAKWKAENDLAAERANRQLAVLKANELDAEVKRYSTNVRVATEKNMVAIEKSHSFLKSTDNVPKSEVDHDVHTVVDSVPGLTEGCTISPDSSASQSDFRKCQKDLLDAEEKNRRFEAAFQKMGISLEAYEMKDKSEWTDTPENHAILDELYPYGYGEEYEYTKVKGKFNAIPCTDLSY